MANDWVERPISGLTIRIDRDLCIGSANCMRLAGDVFEFDAERICAFRPAPAAAERERLIEACRVCPTDALTVLDEQGRRLVP